jgi:DNA invertase Pin-like site-specific DNA recombinase
MIFGRDTMEGRFVSYFRVSTDRQGRSGLGLESQRKIVMDYLNGGGWSVEGEFTEVETGSDDRRPQLGKALALCKRRKATLVVAKLDRLSRDLAFIATLMKSKAKFVVAEMPRASKFELHARALFSEHERDMISARTKAALQQARERGVKLGGPMLPAINAKRRVDAAERAQAIKPVLEKLVGKSAHEAARQLNADGIAAPAGGKWHAMQVHRARRRLGLL